MNRTTFSCLFTILALLCLGRFAATAAADWSDNFDGGFQQAWLFGSVAGGGNPSPTFSATASNGQLVMTDSLPATAGGAAAGFGVVPQFLSDQVMQGVINPSGAAGISPTVTLLARGNLAVGSLYAAEVDYASSELVIFRNDNLTTTINLAEAPIPGLTTDDSLFMVFRLLGANISASVYDAPGGTLLSHVAVTDATFADGLSGVLVNADNPSVPVLGVWDNVSATTIPEPASCLLLVVGAMALAAAHRRYLP